MEVSNRRLPAGHAQPFHVGLLPWHYRQFQNVCSPAVQSEKHIPHPAGLRRFLNIMTVAYVIFCRIADILKCMMRDLGKPDFLI